VTDARTPRSLILAIAAGTGETDPAVIGEKAAAETTAAELRGFYTHVMRDYAREVLTQHRTWAGAASASATPTASSEPGKGQSRAVKVRDAWRRLLDARMHVGVGDEEHWRFLRDCTRDHLLFCVKERQDQAAAMLGAADRYQRLPPRGTHPPAVGVAARRRKGQRANWSTVAKMRAYLIDESCMKQRRSPYRDLYDQRKAATEARRHQVPCTQCDGKGSVAIGTPWRDGHRHADALRIVAKAILRDLWLAARDVHKAAP